LNKPPACVWRTRRSYWSKAVIQERFYLAGYAVECLLKWAVTRRRGILYLPAELETHDWEKLFAETGLREKLAARRDIQRFFNELAAIWAPELRYLAKPVTAEEAERLYEMILAVYNWILDKAI